MTPARIDPVVLLSRSVDQVSGLIAGIREDQVSLPTPCKSWTVALLLDHLVEELPQFTERATGHAPDEADLAPVREGGKLSAFRQRAAVYLEAWRQAGDLDRTIQLPGMGSVSARWPVEQQMTEFAVHGWDLAVATGQPTELDPDVAEAALNWAKENMRPEFRGQEESGMVFGVEVPISDDAPKYDRLAAFFGRSR
jgi:uncharacterized protein (TIGR03086 family)